MLASVITNAASVTLVDTDHITWTEAELLGYLNEALRATALVKPDLFTVQAEVTLAAGVLQNLPAGGIALIDIPRNTSGRVVTQVDLQMLNEVQRFWPAATPEATVEHFTVNPTTPRQFNVYPPNDGTGEVVMLYGAVPTELTAVGDTVPVPDVYQAPLTQYVLSRAYDKNTLRKDLVKSAAAMQNWARAIGAKSQAQAAISPKVASQPGVA